MARSVSRTVFERVGRLAGRVQETRPLAADILESDEAFLVVFDAAGATQGDVQVRFVEGEILVRIDRFRDRYEGFEMRFPGRGLSLGGRIALPADADIDPEAATATLTTIGTLHVTIPKSHQSVDDDGEATVEPVDLEETED